VRRRPRARNPRSPHADGGTSSNSAARRNGSGAGLPRSTSCTEPWSEETAQSAARQDARNGRAQRPGRHGQRVAIRQQLDEERNVRKQRFRSSINSGRSPPSGQQRRPSVRPSGHRAGVTRTGRSAVPTNRCQSAIPAGSSRNSANNRRNDSCAGVRCRQSPVEVEDHRPGAGLEIGHDEAQPR
jgi:hypothetical protein